MIGGDTLQSLLIVSWPIMATEFRTFSMAPCMVFERIIFSTSHYGTNALFEKTNILW
jgi:hypothetical protein